MIFPNILLHHQRLPTIKQTIMVDVIRPQQQHLYQMLLQRHQPLHPGVGVAHQHPSN